CFGRVLYPPRGGTSRITSRISASIDPGPERSSSVSAEGRRGFRAAPRQPENERRALTRLRLQFGPAPPGSALQQDLAFHDISSPTCRRATSSGSHRHAGGRPSSPASI